MRNITPKIIVNPVFFEASHYTVDLFWKHIFHDLAYGEYPYGICIQDNIFLCSIKNKEFNFSLENITAKELYNQIYNLFKSKLNIYSKQDCIDEKSKCNNFNCIKWDDIKKKNLKNVLIEHYVISLKNKYSLNNRQMRTLLYIIMIRLYFKKITNKDIIYDSTKTQITHINLD